jgi:hypothetical protein
MAVILVSYIGAQFLSCCLAALLAKVPPPDQVPVPELIFP